MLDICETIFVCVQIWSHIIDQYVTWHFDRTDNPYSSTGNDQTSSTIFTDKLNHADTFSGGKSCTCLIGVFAKYHKSDISGIFVQNW